MTPHLKRPVDGLGSAYTILGSVLCSRSLVLPSPLSHNWVKVSHLSQVVKLSQNKLSPSAISVRPRLEVDSLLLLAPTREGSLVFRTAQVTRSDG